MKITNRQIEVATFIFTIFYLYIFIDYFFTILEYWHLHSNSTLTDFISSNNWKFWPETLKNINLKDINPIVLFLANFFSVFGIFYILLIYINNIFKYNYNKKYILFIKVLSFILIFNLTNEVSILWNFNELLIMGYFLALLSFYFIVYFYESKKYLYLITSLIALTLSFLIIKSLSVIIVFISLSIYLNNSLRLIKNILLIAILIYFVYSLMQFDLKHIDTYLTYLSGAFFNLSGRVCFSLNKILSLSLILFYFFIIYKIILNKITSKWSISLLFFLQFFFLYTIELVIKDYNSNIHLLYEYKYVILSLIAWTTVYIFISNYFYNRFKKQIIYFGLILSVIFTVYQLFIYKEYIGKYIKPVINIKIDNINKTKLRNLYPNVEFYHWKRGDSQSSFFNKSLKYKIDMLNTPIGSNYNKPIHYNKEFHISVDKIYKKSNRYLNIIGWGYNFKDGYAPKYILILNMNKKIVGFGFSGLYREDVQKAYGDRLKNSGFYAIIKKDDANGSYIFLDRYNNYGAKIEINR